MNFTLKIFQNLIDYFQKKVDQKTRALKDDLLSKDEEISKLRTENKKLIEKSDLSGMPKNLPKTPDIEFVEWTEFVFRTEKEGAYGPSKNECIQYYIKQ